MLVSVDVLCVLRINTTMSARRRVKMTLVLMTNVRARVSGKANVKRENV